MLQLKNETPFKAQITMLTDAHGVDALILTIKAGFVLHPILALADPQPSILVADAYGEDPFSTCLLRAGEIHLPKLGTDIALVGFAQAADHHAVQVLDTSVRVGSTCKSIRVFGDRQWQSGLITSRIGPPVPFERMPMVYERAFGGTVTAKGGSVAYLLNPLGRFFSGPLNLAEMDGCLLPNLEDPEHLITDIHARPLPACYGFIPPFWPPRTSFVGTYDERWQSTRAPYLPEDFDPRFFHTVSPDLICRPFLEGGESVSLINLSPYGPLNFRLPEIRFKLEARRNGDRQEVGCSLETLLFEPEEAKMSIVWRALIPSPRKRGNLEHVNLSLAQMRLAASSPELLGRSA